MPSMIMMIMLAAAGLIILFCKMIGCTSYQEPACSPRRGQATIAVFGVVWMSSTFMDFNYELIKSTLGELVTVYPFLFAVALFTLSICCSVRRRPPGRSCRLA